MSLSRQKDLVYNPSYISKRGAWKLCKLVRDYTRTRNIKNISWEDVKLTTGAPFSAIEIKQKFSNYLVKNSKGKRYFTFEKKVRLLGNNRNICKISPDLTHWDDE